MSVHGYKQTSRGLRQRVRFTPNTGHSSTDVRIQADYVRLALRSGRASAQYSPFAQALLSTVRPDVLAEIVKHDLPFLLREWLHLLLLHHPVE